MRAIIELEDEVAGLGSRDRELFEDIFGVSTSEGELEIPPTFRPKAREYFGRRDKHGRIVESEEEVAERLGTQGVVKTFNKWTGEGALFNWLRAGRPGMTPLEIKEEHKRVSERIKKAMGNCDFCEPRRYTSQDVFGRIEGAHCITGANVAKYDAWSGMVYFRRHDPLRFSLEELADYIETGFRWFERVYEYDEDFRYPFFIWNCLEKAGASQVHGQGHALCQGGDIEKGCPTISAGPEKGVLRRPTSGTQSGWACPFRWRCKDSRVSYPYKRERNHDSHIHLTLGES